MEFKDGMKLGMMLIRIYSIDEFVVMQLLYHCFNIKWHLQLTLCSAPCGVHRSMCVYPL